MAMKALLGYWTKDTEIWLVGYYSMKHATPHTASSFSPITRMLLIISKVILYSSG